MHDNVVFGVAAERGVPVSQARDIVYELVRRDEHIAEATWQKLTIGEKHRIVGSHAADVLVQWGVTDLSGAVIRSVFKFFLSNDGQTWATFWQLSADEKSKPETVSQYSLSAAFRRKNPVSAITYLCHAVTISVLLMVRGLDVLGVIFLIRKRQW